MRYLPKVEVPIDDYPNFSIRQILSASVDYGLPSPHILPECTQQCIWEGAGSQSPLANICLKFKFAVMLIPFLASVSFRQILWASVDYQLLIYCWNADNNVCERGPGAKVPDPIFT